MRVRECACLRVRVNSPRSPHAVVHARMGSVPGAHLPLKVVLDDDVEVPLVFVVGAASPSFVVEQLGILALWWLYGYAA